MSSVVPLGFMGDVVLARRRVCVLCSQGANRRELCNGESGMCSESGLRVGAENSKTEQR